MALSAKQRPFRVGDRVKCLHPNYSFVGHAGTIVRKDMSCGRVPIWQVKIDGNAGGPYSLYAKHMELLSPAPSSFSSVKTILEVWASLPPFLQKDAAEDTLRMLVRVYGGEKE